MSSATPTAITNFRFAKLRDLSIVHPNWKNPRTMTGLDGAEIVDLGKDMKAHGTITPLVVQKVYKNKDKDPSDVINLVLAGQRRYLAAEEVFSQEHELPVVDRTVEPIELTKEAGQELMLQMLSEVARREGLSAYELSEVAQDLRDAGKTLSEIAKACHRDDSWVSKILTARKNADPKLLLRWRKGEITEEQFKTLAAIKDPEKQLEGAKAAVKARESGDAAEARASVKELAERYKNDERKAAAPPKPAPKAIAETSRDAKPEKPAVRVVIKPAVLEEMLDMADKRPPTADYARGVIDAVKFITGEIEMADLSKAWHAWVSRATGAPKPKKGKKARGKKSPAKKKRR